MSHAAPIRSLRRRFRSFSRRLQHVGQPRFDAGPPLDLDDACHCALHTLVWQQKERRIRRGSRRALSTSR